MSYISKLSAEEKNTVCEIIGGKYFKELFVINSNEFNKIRPGFRVNKLTDVQALDIALKNVCKAGMVYDFTDAWVARKMKEINDCISEHEISGKSHDEALPITLVDSYFVNHIELYFKLNNEVISEEKLLNIEQEVEKIKLERSDIIKANEKISELEYKINELKEELKIAYRENSKILDENEKTISDYETKISELNDKIADLSEELQYAESKREVEEKVISDEEQLLLYEDEIPKGLPKQYSEETFSLCKVGIDYSGDAKLIRIADINNYGNLSEFHVDENRPLMFDNRSKLFHRDGPTENGMYAVWEWTAVPNFSGSEKDYVTTKYNSNIIPIEIIKLTECDTIESLIETIKKGFEYKIHSKKIMFTISNEQRKYEGVLCQAKDIENNQGVLSLADSVNLLPVYEFQMNDAIVDNDGTIFFGKVYAGIPSKLYRIKNHMDIVKNMVLDTISWQNYKAKGIAKAEYKCFKEIISSIQTEELVKKIAFACNCTARIAAELLEQFILKVSDYIDEKSIEDDIIESALKNNASLMERTKALINAEWKAQNSDLIKTAEAELNEVYEKKKQAISELEQIKTNHTKFIEEMKSFTAKLTEKEKLATDVETAIEDKIKNAKENAADFIANMAFINPFVVQGTQSKLNDFPDLFEIGELTFDKNEAESHHNWKEIIRTLDFELEEAGVSSDYSFGLATFLCASYIARESIFLIGPNADAIAEAFAISLFGCNLGILNCRGEYSKSLISNTGFYGHLVVMVKNITQSRWIEYLPDLLNDNEPNPYCFFVHPFSEDIQVESKCLYNYVLPLFTEFFVDKKANRDYKGGYFSDDFSSFVVPFSEKYKDVMALSANKLVKTRLNQILTIMHSINKELSNEDDFIYGALQYAYATLDNDLIKKRLSDKESNLSNSLKRDLMCVLGEVE